MSTKTEYHVEAGDGRGNYQSLARYPSRTDAMKRAMALARLDWQTRVLQVVTTSTVLDAWNRTPPVPADSGAPATTPEGDKT